MRSTALPAPASAQLPCPTDRRGAHVRLEVEDIYETHVDFVWRTARWLGTPMAHLDDVVQEVFVVVQRRLAEFEGRSQLTTWLFAITRHVVRAQLRKDMRQRQLSTHAVDDAIQRHVLDAESLMLAEEDMRVLQELLSELDHDKREVFVLAELEELSGPAIAQALDLSLSNVYARLRMARQAFAAALRRHRARESRRP